MKSKQQSKTERDLLLKNWILEESLGQCPRIQWRTYSPLFPCSMSDSWTIVLPVVTCCPGPGPSHEAPHTFKWRIWSLLSPLLPSSPLASAKKRNLQGPFQHSRVRTGTENSGMNMCPRPAHETRQLPSAHWNSQPGLWFTAGGPGGCTRLLSLLSEASTRDSRNYWPTRSPWPNSGSWALFSTGLHLELQVHPYQV